MDQARMWLLCMISCSLVTSCCMALQNVRVVYDYMDKEYCDQACALSLITISHTDVHIPGWHRYSKDSVGCKALANKSQGWRRHRYVISSWQRPVGCTQMGAISVPRALGCAARWLPSQHCLPSSAEGMHCPPWYPATTPNLVRGVCSAQELHRVMFPGAELWHTGSCKNTVK